MSIASEITRLQGVKADILTAISDKGVTVPAGSALDDCPRLIGSIGDITSVKIAGTTYAVTKIDDKYWMAESLRYETSSFSYVNGDPSTKDTYGLLYKYKILCDEFFPLIPDGWRMPRRSDFEKLFTAHNNQLDFISTSKGGNNSLGFNDELGGTRNWIGNYINFGVGSAYWTCNYYEIMNGSPYYVRYYNSKIDKNEGLSSSASTAIDAASDTVYSALSVRLIHD